MASMVERAASDLWAGNAVRGPHFGVCDTCGRERDHDDRLLLVARQHGSRRFECLECWDQPAEKRAAA